MPSPPDDVGYNKAAIVERSLRRAFEEYRSDPSLADWTHIDALTLNIERACQAVIDLAFHVVAKDRLGMPQTSADAFSLMARAGYIDASVTKGMVAMTGFRNIAVHEYQALDLSVLRAIVDGRWRSLADFLTALGYRIEPETGSGTDRV
ncbi:MAG: DUF86 domain-containing protein [Spirochaetales bacterium]|nr:DUF86 domain-containing protein [Spirochaetales bacterium]